MVRFLMHQMLIALNPDISCLNLKQWQAYELGHTHAIIYIVLNEHNLTRVGGGQIMSTILLPPMDFSDLPTALNGSGRLMMKMS